MQQFTGMQEPYAAPKQKQDRLNDEYTYSTEYIGYLDLTVFNSHTHLYNTINLILPKRFCYQLTHCLID